MVNFKRDIIGFRKLLILRNAVIATVILPLYTL